MREVVESDNSILGEAIIYGFLNLKFGFENAHLWLSNNFPIAPVPNFRYSRAIFKVRPRLVKKEYFQPAGRIGKKLFDYFT